MTALKFIAEKWSEKLVENHRKYNQLAEESHVFQMI